MNNKQLQNNKHKQFSNIIDLAIKPLSSFYPLKDKISKKSFVFNDEKIIKVEQKKAFINKPIILKKKESSIKVIRYINNDTGKMRHFTPAAQE
jgi:hypothetical protein